MTNPLLNLVMRIGRRCTLGLVAAACLGAGPLHAQSPAATTSAVRDADRIVVLVNSEPITTADVRARMARMEPPPGGTLPPANELSRQVLDQLINERTQLQWAREIGIRVEDANVNEAEATVARQNGLTVPQLHDRLRAMGITPTAFRANLRDELLLQRVREREVDGRVRVSEQEIDAYLREHETPASLADTVLHLGHIFIRVPENADAATTARLEAQAREAATRARAGESFATLVQAFSQGPEVSAGGQMGVRTADRYPPLFVEAVQSLRRGDVAGPVRSGAGFHVLKVLQKRSTQMPEDTIPETLARHILLRSSAQTSEAALVQQLDELRARIVSGQTGFEAAAREVSQDGSAREGGVLGWARPGMFVPEFEQAMNRLNPGEVSRPVVSRFGVHLIQVVERREAALSTRERREWVRNAVRERKLAQAFEDWSRELRGRAFIEFRETER